MRLRDDERSAGRAAAVIALVVGVLLFAGAVGFLRSLRAPAPAPPLAGSGKMLVRFVDADGDPVRGVQHEIRHTLGGGGSGNGGVAHDGWRIVNAPREGTLVLDASGRRTMLGRTAETEHVRVQVPSPRPAELVVTIGRSLHIRGRVVSEAGEAVPGADVTAHVPGGWGGSFMTSRSSRTDSDGEFDIPSCGALAYEIRVQPPPEWVRPAPVPVRGGTEDVSIVVRRGSRARITVQDVDGRPIVGARVAAVRAEPARNPTRREVDDTDPLPATTGDDGSAVVGGIDPARKFTLDVAPPQSRADLFPEELKDWDCTDRVVRLEPAFEASGVVVTQTGVPIPGADVLKRETPQSLRGTTCDAEGRFRLSGLRRGTSVEIFATCGSFGLDAVREIATDVRTATRVEAGATDVRLVLDVRGFVILVAANGDDTEARNPFAAPAVRWSRDTSSGLVSSLPVRKPLLIPGLDPGRTVTILVGPSRLGRCALLRDLVPDGRRIDVLLERCEPLAGRVDGAAGDGSAAQRPQFVVELSLGDVVLVTQHVAPDGTFRIAGLPDAEWMICARALGSWDRPGAGIAVRPGAATVVVPAPPKPAPEWK